jgi:hypothetical protein
MQGKVLNIPFGLLFEEDAKSPETIITPIYDEERDLSLIEDAHGRMVPIVELGFGIGTDTETKVRQESTDTDPWDDHSSLSITSTTTVTEVRSETTDTDPEDDNAQQFQSYGLGTDTGTAVQAESTDTDPEDDPGAPSVWRCFLATDTITRREGESTDRD